jgi:site-specific DNA recombinase
LEGKWVGSRPPYGYRAEDGDLLLGEEEKVWTVREIFKQYTTTDKSLGHVAHILNERGIPAPSGRLWTRSAVRGILIREAYKGTAIQFRDSKGKFHTIKDKQIAINSGKYRKPEEEWFVVQCPEIVDEETWDQAQEKIVRRRGKTSPTRSSANLLAGLLYCGHCGAGMIGADRRTTSAGDAVYVCGTYHRHGTHGAHGCNRNLIHETPILTFLGENIRETILAPKNFEKLRAAVNRKVKARQKSEPADTTRMRKQLTNLDGDLKKAMTELRRTPDDLYDLAVDEVRQIRQRRDNVAAELTDAESRQDAHTSPVEIDVERVLGRVQALREGLSSVDPAVSRNVLSELCERVDLWFEHTKFNGKNSRPMVRSKFARGLVSFTSANLLPHGGPS